MCNMLFFLFIGVVVNSTITLEENQNHRIRRMKYYLRKYNSQTWKRIDMPTALLVFIKPREWGCACVGWHIDMLTVPNLIDCADAELLVIGRDGAKPIRGMKNLRHDEYYDELKRIVTKWVRDMQKQVYKTEHLFYIPLNEQMQYLY